MQSISVQPTPSTTSHIPKANLSLKLPIETKAELQKIAKIKNRSVHYLLLEAVEQYIHQQNDVTTLTADQQYENWVQQKVLSAYDRVQKEGVQGKPTQEVSQLIMARLDEFLVQHTNGNVKG